MGRVSKAGGNRQLMQHYPQQQHSLGQPMPSLFPDDISALLRKASAGKGSMAALKQREKKEKEK